MADSILLGHVTSQWARASHLGCWYKENCPSTNEKAKDEAFSEEAEKYGIKLYLTDEQTKGRGRGQNTWLSPQKGTALLSSWSFQVAANPQPVLSALVGLSVFRALSTTWPALPWSLKAPNDIYLGELKVGGILLENVHEGSKNRLIVGFGLNVLGYPEEIENSGCIAQFFPEGLSLTGEDWTAALDRLLLELTMAVATDTSEGLSDSTRLALMYALNRSPLLAEPITDVEADGSLIRGKKRTPWSDL